MRSFVLLILFGLAGGTFAVEPLYVQPLLAQTRDADQRAEARRKLNEYAEASRLPLLKEGDPDEIRIWVTWANFRADTIGYETEGYVFEANNARTCRIKYPHSKSTPIKGSCARLRKATVYPPSAFELEALANLSGRELDCGVSDGAWLEIDGAYKGHQFSLGSSNPDQCLDDGSKVVAKIMAHVLR